MYDDLDRKIIHGLTCAPRVSFRRLGEIIGVSEQTVARRYNALRRDGVLRVVGMSGPTVHGGSEWIARLRCRPDAVGPVAGSLARRPEVGYVSIDSGGSEIICAIRSSTRAGSGDVLLRQLPKATAILDMSVDLLIHTFSHPGAAGWTGGRQFLTDEQVRRLTAGRPAPVGPPLAPTDEDRPLFKALAEDGRAPHTRLAEATGWSGARVARRLEALEATGSLTYGVDILNERLGYELNATVWLQVDLPDLHRIGEELGRHDECAFVAATSGKYNLMAVVICEDTPALYRYLSGDLARLKGIRGYEISIRARRLKQSVSLIHHGRLVHPALG
ncbi:MULTISPECIES: Lrp/AsnC family transcriptional regulator [unclassified Streptomyces]|uniref:Lrp/AsnC family transcriptional regulator n=1 Tax=unclassified Streptomyces TaxID=2593676 RepID=UPI001660E279|nr:MULTISPECIES: AsnC family transcriptional regulator [unclassified Streptomyces]MBD0707014.1 AsnC family transcriptional regulator [Streptomyces sp. CBMA291]MBD0712953.1 AsnC family transcriptional regulator [Streptomyces sp. CBMA370]